MKEKQTNPTIRQILKYLIVNYGSQSGVNLESFPKKISDDSNISEKSARNWLFSDKLKKDYKLRKNSADVVVNFFRPAIPNFQTSWLSAKSLAEFKTYITSSAKPYDGNYVLSKNYICYRYAFDNTGKITRELLTFSDNFSRFTFHIPLSRNNGPTSISKFNGTVCHFEHSLLLVGQDNLTPPQRSRCMMVRQETDNERLNDYRFGILLGVDSNSNEPTATRIVMEALENNWNTKEDDIKNIVQFYDPNDFLKEHDIAQKILDQIQNTLDYMNHDDYVMTLYTNASSRKLTAE